MEAKGVELHILNKDIKCLECGHIGAIKSYGSFYENGLGDMVDSFGSILKPIMEKNRNIPYISRAGGFGGTIPYECTNCGNRGLDDMDGLEGYRKTFEKIKRD
jgi:DNA-directed RNA polymerase subunit RPC12/RpoP